MISYQSDPASLRELGEQWQQAYSNNVPFPHIVVDDFFDSRTLGGVLCEVNALDRSQRYAKFLDRKTDHNKFAYFPEVVGPETSRLVNFLNSGPFLSYMENLTGIDNLIADPSYFGGGLHWIENGGFLDTLKSAVSQEAWQRFQADYLSGDETAYQEAVRRYGDTRAAARA